MSFKGLLADVGAAAQVVWLIGCLGREISPPKEFDDPSIVCADLMNAIKLLGFPPPSFSATKLHKGYGPEVSDLCFLRWLPAR